MGVFLCYSLISQHMKPRLAMLLWQTTVDRLLYFSSRKMASNILPPYEAIKVRLGCEGEGGGRGKGVREKEEGEKREGCEGGGGGGEEGRV